MGIGIQYYPGKENLSDKDLIEELKRECKRVKIQRNDYEAELTIANRKINKLQSELTLLENYINGNPPKTNN